MVPSCIAGVTVTNVATLEKQLGSFPCQLPYDATVPLQGIYLREMKIFVHRRLYMNVHSITSQNTPKVEITQTFTGKCMNKLAYPYL